MHVCICSGVRSENVGKLTDQLVLFPIVANERILTTLESNETIYI